MSYLIKNKNVDTLSYKTVSANKETADKKWYVVDAEGQTVGRLASKVAKIIRGKHKPNYTPHADCGDNIIVVNAEKVSFSGTKLADKRYVRYSGYPGGQRSMSAELMLQKHPERLIEKAVKGTMKSPPANMWWMRLIPRFFAGTIAKQLIKGKRTVNCELRTLSSLMEQENISKIDLLKID